MSAPPPALCSPCPTLLLSLFTPCLSLSHPSHLPVSLLSSLFNSSQSTCLNPSSPCLSPFTPCLIPLLSLSHFFPVSLISCLLPNSFPLPLLLLSLSHSFLYLSQACQSPCLTPLIFLYHSCPLLSLSHSSPLPVSLISCPGLTSNHRLLTLFEAHDVMQNFMEMLNRFIPQLFKMCACQHIVRVNTKSDIIVIGIMLLMNTQSHDDQPLLTQHNYFYKLILAESRHIIF